MMQTIIGIVICLVVIVYYVICFMNQYQEGLENNTTPAATPTSGVATSPGLVPLATVATDIHKEVDAVANLSGILSNKDNVTRYETIIDDLLDYYDHQTLIALANIKKDPTLDVYELRRIIQYKEIKVALNESLTFLQLYR
jgi:hypothetical protein